MKKFKYKCVSCTKIITESDIPIDVDFECENCSYNHIGNMLFRKTQKKNIDDSRQIRLKDGKRRQLIIKINSTRNKLKKARKKRIEISMKKRTPTQENKLIKISQDIKNYEIFLKENEQ